MAKSRSQYSLEILLGAKKASSFQNGIDGAKSGLQGISSTAKKVAGLVGAAFGAIQIKDFVKESVDTFSDYEQSLANTAAIANATQTEQEQLNEAAREAGKATTKTAKESADALGYMALAGWNVKESTSALQPVLKLSAASNMDLATCSDLVTDSMSALKLSVKDLPEYLDMVTKAQNSSNMNSQQMMEAYIKAGGAARTLGISAKDTGVALGILANNGYRTIVVVGGDGALNDAINGIMSSNAENKREIAIGIIPNGIGNDFAKYWEMTSEYKDAVDCIINNRRRKIDVGFCNYYDGEKHVTRYFLNAINIGLGARIVKITDQTKRFWGMKYLSYLMALISIIFERKLYRMHLKINGEHIRGRIMTVCIGSAWGYGQAPSAVPYNGWLDVSVIYRPELLQLISGLWMLIQGRILNHKVVMPYRTQKVKVLRAQNASVDLDGRILDRHFPLDIGIMHEAITLIIPN